MTYLGYEVENKRLPAGDFEGQYVIGEIKRNGTNNDFFHSIIDKRIFNQPKRMLLTGKKPFMLVAGDPADTRWRLKPVIGALMCLVLDFQLQLIHVPNSEGVIAYTIHKILQKDSPNLKSPLNIEHFQTKSRRFERKLHRNTLVEMLRSIPGVGVKTAVAISKEFSSVVDLCAASERDIRGINDVGQKKASSIFHHLRGIPDGDFSTEQ